MLVVKGIQAEGDVFRLQIARQAKGIDGEYNYFEHPFVQVWRQGVFYKMVSTSEILVKLFSFWSTFSFKVFLDLLGVCHLTTYLHLIWFHHLHYNSNLATIEETTTKLKINTLEVKKSNQFYAYYDFSITRQCIQLHLLTIS